MQIEIVMPKLADSMTEGAVVAWLKNEGETVRAGEAIAEIETEKSTVDLEAPADGVLAAIRIAAGTEHVAVGAVLALIDTDAVATATSGAATASTATSRVATAASATMPPGGGETGAPAEGAIVVASRETIEDSSTISAGATIALIVSPNGNGSLAAGDGDSLEIAATPLARRMAVQAGIVLSTLRATGIGGKICKADVEHALREPGATRSPAINGRASDAIPPTAGPLSSRAPAPPPPSSSPASAPAPRTSRMRRTIAERMTRAKQTVPHFYLSVDCRVDRLLETRRRLNDDADGAKISLNDFVVRAAALALRRVPAANASWIDEGVQLHDAVDIAVAVALDDGLVTPVVRGADVLGLGGIAATVTDLAARARAGGLAPHEYDGGTFTVSNLGMFGVGTMYAILNPPQACILGVGAAEQKPVVQDGALAVGTVMTLSLSADHRVLDGAIGARLLAEIRRLLEDPARMLV